MVGGSGVFIAHRVRFLTSAVRDRLRQRQFFIAELTHATRAHAERALIVRHDSDECRDAWRQGLRA